MRFLNSKQLWWSSVALLALAFQAAPARADVIRVSPLVGLNYYNPSVSPLAAGESGSGKLGFNYGILGAIAVAPGFMFETGILHNGNSVDLKSAGTTLNLSARSWEIPFGLRFEALPMISFGFGGYYESFQDGTAEVNGGASSDFSWNDSSQIGLKLGARYTSDLAGPLGLFVDLAYKLGLSSRTTGASTGSYKDRSLALSVGVNLGI